jgi:hypothetical protein
MRTHVDFADPRAVRRVARIIAFAIIGGAITFALVIPAISTEPRLDNPQEHPLHTPFVVVAAMFVFVATAIGTRMHGYRGTLAERTSRTFKAQIAGLALSEAATLLGLVLVLITRSWDSVLPAALGFGGLATCAIRGEVRFGSLVTEAAARRDDPGGYAGDHGDTA